MEDDKNVRRDLSKPKLLGSYSTSFPLSQFATQNLIRPVSQAALSHVATERTKQLSQPTVDRRKSSQLNRKNFELGNPSLISIIKSSALKYIPTERIKELAKPKMLHPFFIKNRDISEVFKVSAAALNFQADDRIDKLSKPKDFHPDSKPDRTSREVLQVSRNALTSKANSRIISLSEPKKIKVPEIKRAPGRPVSKAIMDNLSKPKPLSPEYLKPATPDEVNQVKPEALKAVASTRLQALATPVQRADTKSVNYKPEAFAIPSAALKAVASTRLQDLAKPKNR